MTTKGQILLKTQFLATFFAICGTAMCEGANCWVYEGGETCQSQFGNFGEDERCNTTLQCEVPDIGFWPECIGWGPTMLRDYFTTEEGWGVKHDNVRVAVETDLNAYPLHPVQPDYNTLCYTEFTCNNLCSWNSQNQVYECVSNLFDTNEWFVYGTQLDTLHPCVLNNGVWEVQP